MKANNLIIRLKSPCKEWLGRLNRSYLSFKRCYFYRVGKYCFACKYSDSAKLNGYSNCK